MEDTPLSLPARFQPAYKVIQELAQHQRYLGAFIFGSVARGEGTEQSGLDVIVMIDTNNPCEQINHPIINGVKLDITFRSLEQIRYMEQNIIDKRERIPWLAESLIVFDKTGALYKLQKHYSQVRPHEISPEHHLTIQFLVFNENNKIERNLESDPATALYAMHAGLNELLKFHYQIQRHWQVSSKRLLKDLRAWDPSLVLLIEQFVATSEPQLKFQHWSSIIDHILAPLGGWVPIEENNCTCNICSSDLLHMKE